MIRSYELLEMPGPIPTALSEPFWANSLCSVAKHARNGFSIHAYIARTAGANGFPGIALAATASSKAFRWFIALDISRGRLPCRTSSP
jgi:hypothetical protein